MMNHARTLCRSISTIWVISLSVNFSRIESKTCEKMLIACVSIACREICGGNRNTFF